MTVKQYLVIESVKMLILEMRYIDTFWSHGFCSVTEKLPRHYRGHVDGHQVMQQALSILTVWS